MDKTGLSVGIIGGIGLGLLLGSKFSGRYVTILGTIQSVPITEKEIKNMNCLKCAHNWERTKWTEYISFLAKCPKCGSRLIVRY